MFHTKGLRVDQDLDHRLRSLRNANAGFLGLLCYVGANTSPLLYLIARWRDWYVARHERIGTLQNCSTCVCAWTDHYASYHLRYGTFQGYRTSPGSAKRVLLLVWIDSHSRVVLISRRGSGFQSASTRPTGQEVISTVTHPPFASLSFC